MHGGSRCLRCGPVPPLHVPAHTGAEILASVVGRVAADAEPPGPDPGPQVAAALRDPGPGHPERVPAAKIRAGGHPTPLWLVNSPTDRSAYAGEARGMWLHAIAWPASAGHLLAEEVVLHDLTEWTPPALVYGAPSPYLHGWA